MAFSLKSYLIFSNLESEDYDSEVDGDDNEADDDKQVEDEGEHDEDEEDDYDDDDDIDETANSLHNPVQQSSDPAWPILPAISVIRGARRLARRFRRRRSRGRRVGRWFRRRRSRG